MKESRRITITTTRRLRLSAVRATCPVCGCEVTTLAPGEAIAVLGVAGERFDETESRRESSSNDKPSGQEAM